ncbi:MULTISPECIES: hypothetical protein [unclassified Pseudomonas]|uniref:hypothetical protein n=1 Tax=unclassified Pseudomonas TaxID=196821 RepID=UPI000A1E3C1A|nr:MULTISPECIES: hypothetical protein [unclassified Pseudomonas]
MQKTSRIKFLLLALLLLISVSQAATGPETAQLLNQRYQNTTTQCPGDNPAYFCSGVLLRGSEGTQVFWKHSTQAVQLGAEGFNYLRADLDTRSLTQAYGAVFSDQFTAIGQDKALDVLCAYPFEFAVQGTRPDFGCGWTATVKAQDASSCTTQGATDVQSWLAHFAQQGNQPAKQCSLSTQDPAQFSASLIAHQRIGTEWSVQPTLLQIKNWDDQAPKRLPLQGLFYDVTKTGSLLGAQKDQRDYFNATGDWLPVLRMDLSQKPDAVFGFNQQDQLYIGYQVAAKMNARYADTAATCRDNSVAHNCNGVLIRGANASESYRAWNPSPNSVSRNGVSFSYLRADVGTIRLFDTQGFTFKESHAPTAHPGTLRCAYPANASTSGIPDSCRASCASQNITTVAQWQAKYASSPGGSCAFGNSPADFQLSISVRSTMTDTARQQWNEIIIAAWPQDIPRQIPLEALFYIAGSSPGLNNAKFIQRDYFQHTARYLPILRLTLTASGLSPFSFDTTDQSVQGTSMQTLANGITPRASNGD